MLVALCACGGESKARPATSADATSSAERQTSIAVREEVVGLTNTERSRRGRAPLRANARLMHAAQLHAEQMARSRQLAHVLPKAAYPRIEDRLAAAKYGWQSYGENVALGQASGAAAVESWMHSRGHRENILNPDFTEIGVGLAKDKAGQPYYVQVFAGPLS